VDLTDAESQRKRGFAFEKKKKNDSGHSPVKSMIPNHSTYTGTHTHTYTHIHPPKPPSGTKHHREKREMIENLVCKYILNE
jgi:hypothetical protein